MKNGDVPQFQENHSKNEKNVEKFQQHRKLTKAITKASQQKLKLSIINNSNGIAIALASMHNTCMVYTCDIPHGNSGWITLVRNENENKRR